MPRVGEMKLAVLVAGQHLDQLRAAIEEVAEPYRSTAPY